MKVLLSIKPEFASKIFEGSKKYEYRRTIFKRSGVTTIVMYVSNPVKNVIGEFEIEGIIQEEPQSLWEKTGEQGGISKERFLNYFKNKTKGYAIKVGSAKKYEVPVPLHNLMVVSPPQSFAYLYA
jgi:predicted transcriptional regulator